jgi:methylthioribulose-1-phosphate dehydratase
MISSARHPAQLHPALGDLVEQIDALRDVGAVFWQRGWSVGTSSNYSVVVSRDPLELLVTASGKDKGRLTRGDFVRIAASGKPVADGQPKSSAETLLHIVAASQPGVGAVLHTHSIWSTLLSEWYGPAGGLAIAGYEMLKGLEGIATHEHREWVPILENDQDMPRLADRVRGLLTAEPHIHAFLLRRHGLYTWGESISQAVRHVEILEFLLEAVARTDSRGGASWLS